eukprot:scaffold27019_cov24-Tisochrysis_lutea.AAC.1
MNDRRTKAASQRQRHTYSHRSHVDVGVSTTHRHTLLRKAGAHPRFATNAAALDCQRLQRSAARCHRGVG